MILFLFVLCITSQLLSEEEKVLRTLLITVRSYRDTFLLYAVTKILITEGYLSRVMRKQDFCICENKDADQLRGNRETVVTAKLIIAFVFAT